MNSREKILNSVRKMGEEFEFTALDPVHFIKSEDTDLLNEYMIRATQNQANVALSSDLLADINAIIAKENCSNLIYPKDLPIDVNHVQIASKFAFDKPIEEFKSEIFNYDVSIIQASKAVSSHGVFCVNSSVSQPRLLSLTPRVCIVLLKKENIVKSLSDAFYAIKNELGALPTNLLFICGPSRTSDVELVTVLGVHGSQIVHILIY